VREVQRAGFDAMPAVRCCASEEVGDAHRASAEIFSIKSSSDGMSAI